MEQFSTVAKASIGLGSIFAMGLHPLGGFSKLVTTFTLSGVIGYNIVWGVSHALHSPLMAVTNAVWYDCRRRSHAHGWRRGPPLNAPAPRRPLAWNLLRQHR